MSADGPIPEAPDQSRWTERHLLDLIRQRYGQTYGNGPRYVVAEHVRNQGGFGTFDPNFAVQPGTNGRRRTTLRTADALVIDLWPSTGNLIHGFEVKVSRSDWLTELRDPEKAEAFRPYCDHWWLAVPDKSIVRDDLPAGWGLLAVGANGKLRVAKQAPKIDRQPVPIGLMASWLRSVAKGASGE